MRLPLADFPWEWGPLSVNEALVIQDLLDYPDKPWDWSTLTNNSAFSIWDIIDHLELPWVWSLVTVNADIKAILMYRHLPWVWEKLSDNPTVTWQVVLDHPEIPWPELPILDYINSQYGKVLQPETAYEMTSEVSLEFIFAHNWQWNWFWLSSRADLTIQDVIDHLDCPWDWNQLSFYTTPRDIFAHLDLPWEWECVSQNSGLSIRDILDNDCDWDWEWLSRNDGISIEDIRNNPSLPWSWKYVSCNPNLLMRDIDNRPWNWTWVSIYVKMDHPTRSTALPADFHRVWGIEQQPRDILAAKLLMLCRECPFFQFGRIVCMLPPELQELVCALVYNHRQISARTLKIA